MKTKYSILTLFIIINVIIMVYIDKVESSIINNNNNSNNNKDNNEYSISNNNNNNSNNNKDNNEYSISNNNNNDELCAAPLIYVNNSNNNNSDPYDTGRLCIKGCCLPCPISDNLYKKDELHKIYYILNFIRAISFICEIFIVMSYLVLPNKRDHPGITVLFFNVSLLMFLGVSLLDVVKYRDTMCHDAVTQSTFDNNPIICGTQGLALVFATFMLVLWCFLLILQLHCQTVWRSSYIKTHYIFFQIIIFTIAITFTLLSGVTKRINYEFGPFCMVNSEYKYWYFWYPLAVFVIPGFMMHIWTIIYMVRLYWINSMNKTSLSFNSGTVKTQEIVNLLRMQWRVFMLAVSYLSTYTICQLFVILETPKLEVLKLPINQQPKWTSDWFECIISGKGQDECSQYSIPNVANVNFLVMAETSTASLGISMFIIFCSSKNLWIEWKNLFVRIFNSKCGFNSKSINIGGLK